MPRLLHRCGVECYVTGNYSRDETKKLGQHVEHLLKVCHHPYLYCCHCYTVAASVLLLLE